MDLENVKVSKKKQAASLPAQQRPKVAGLVPSPDRFREQAQGSCFILTAAQNNTKVHSGFWKNLTAYAKFKSARILVSQITYNKSGFQNATKSEKNDDLWYDERVIPYVRNDDIQLAPGIVFSAELDILPTAKDPLSGLDNYTGTHSMVVPHTKVHMRSYAGLLSGQPQRFAYTTGACTLRNYIDRRAGQIASYHHVYGALLVERKGEAWFARQLIADDDGSFFDLSAYISDGKVHGENSDYLRERFPEFIRVCNLGDIHAEKMDPVAFNIAKNMLSSMRFTHVAIHDLLDFEARNHHNLHDPFFLAEQHFNGMNTVEGNFKHAVVLLSELERVSGASMLLVRSNHDEAFHRWLREYDTRQDPANAEFYHYHMWQKYRHIAKGSEWDSYEQALELAAFEQDIDHRAWVHIKEDDSYVLHGIEFGLHGHLGPNGARGNPKSYRQLGRKLNTGHTHSASIIDGVWTSGVLASLRMGYNKGPSSWSHSHIITQPNGKRQMITFAGEGWRA